MRTYVLGRYRVGYGVGHRSVGGKVSLGDVVFLFFIFYKLYPDCNN